MTSFINRLKPRTTSNHTKNKLTFLLISFELMFTNSRRLLKPQLNDDNGNETAKKVATCP